jgi:membrane protease YdiL (CAAX protease family)
VSQEIPTAEKPKSWKSAVLVVAIVYPSLLTWVYFVLLQDNQASVQQTAYAIGKIAQFVLPIGLVWFCDRAFFKNNKFMGLGKLSPQNELVGIGFGIFVGVAMLAIYFGFLSSTEIAAGLIEKVKEKTVGIGIDTTWKYAGLGVFYAICHSFLEEYYWRWFVFGNLRERISLPWAIVISSLGFMAHHVILLTVFLGVTSPLAYLFAGAVGIGGAFWAWLYHRSGSLLAPWTSHLIVDAGIFTLGYLLIRPFLAG